VTDADAAMFRLSHRTGTGPRPTAPRTAVLPGCSHEVMSDRASDGRLILGPDALAHLRVPPTGICWWRQKRPATTGEHKFKRVDLTRLMANGGPLLWGDTDGNTRETRGSSGVTRDRYGVIKFPKSLCEPCNNKRSKPFDNAYDVYSHHVSRTWLRIMPGVDFRQNFGTDWEAPTLNLARYYGKHFGCRMVRAGVPVPGSLPEFLNGATDMPDAHMALITTDTVHKLYKGGLSISPDFVAADKNISRFVRYVLVAYVGSIGVRYEWSEEGFPEPSQFFHYPHPVINCLKTRSPRARAAPIVPDGSLLYFSGRIDRASSLISVWIWPRCLWENGVPAVLAPQPIERRLQFERSASASERPQLGMSGPVTLASGK